MLKVSGGACTRNDVAAKPNQTRITDMTEQADQRSQAKKRILFFAEGVTLAHVARPFVLASSLPPERYQVVFACHPRFRQMFSNDDFEWIAIDTIPSQQFLDALAKGTPVYNSATLERYVREDLDIIESHRPDAVVGDFRLSLAISARLQKTPYLTISNAYWSPYSHHPYPAPDIPVTQTLGSGLGGGLFKMVRPLAFALHTLPMNSVCRKFGRPMLGADLRRIYTEADVTLYADLPGLVPLHDAPANHRHIGPVAWSPDVELPTWWDALPTEKPLAYVTPGSSGGAGNIVELLKALTGEGFSVMAATAGRVDLPADMPGIFSADYLPGREAAGRASLVICNGGSPTSMQALEAGVPVIGLPSNLDQYLNMHYLESAGVGLTLPARLASGQKLIEAVKTIARDDSMREKAKKTADCIAQHPPEPIFHQAVEDILGPTP